MPRQFSFASARSTKHPIFVSHSNKDEALRRRRRELCPHLLSRVFLGPREIDHSTAELA